MWGEHFFSRFFAPPASPWLRACPNIYIVRDFNACSNNVFGPLLHVLFLLRTWLATIWWNNVFSWSFHLCKWYPWIMRLLGSLCFLQSMILCKCWNANPIHFFWAQAGSCHHQNYKTTLIVWWHAKTVENSFGTKHAPTEANLRNVLQVVALTNTSTKPRAECDNNMRHNPRHIDMLSQLCNTKVKSFKWRQVKIYLIIHIQSIHPLVKRGFECRPVATRRAVSPQISLCPKHFIPNTQ